MKFPRPLMVIAAAGAGCAAILTDRAPPGVGARPGKGKGWGSVLSHQEERMSGKVLWRNNKNHAAGSNCMCGFTKIKHKCSAEEDDDSHCFLVCCIAKKTSDCKCGWAIETEDACNATKDDGSKCFNSCCRDVQRDLQKYGPLAYPGAELLYPVDTPIP